MAQLFPLNSLPSSIETLFRASITSIKKPGNTIPDKGYTIKNLAIDKKQYEGYCRMFGFDESTVPSPYWYVRLFGLQSLLMAHPDAPFPLPGMVHLSCEIKQFNTIYPSDRLDATCQFGRLIQHDKGTAIEIITTLTRNDKIVWQQKNINLYLGKKGIGEAAEEKPAIDITTPDNIYPWSLATHLGLEYAKVSGDFNPIHLHTLGAKLLGFPKHLIHGWYSLSRAVAPIQSATKGIHELYVSFKKPLFLPGKVISRIQNVNDNTTFFDVINEKEAYPHLKGYIKQ
ncbi:MAG: hypothetical protein LC105_11490 [Chitinophagales bacterium]|nr:hypothetical protein [Chitinophagales bacterium]MCZ2394473.1 hypothetical protein [Chitinophagales bacterium]